MPSLKLDCPHCGTVGAGFTGDQYRQVKPGNFSFIMLMQCGVCGEGIVAKFFGTHFSGWVAGHGESDTKLISSWPSAASHSAPEFVPQHIQQYFLQALDNASRSNWDAAGIMFRKTLDASLKNIDPSGSGTLYNRITNLPASIGITDALKECAHEIRRLGADAAHEDDPFTEEEVSAIKFFTDLFLTYAFTLPGMLEARKATITAPSA